MENEEPEVSSFGFAGKILVVLALIAAVVFGYHERNVAKRLNHENTQMAASLVKTQTSLNTMQGQLEGLRAKVTSVETEKAAAVAAKPSAAVVAVRRPEPVARRDDPRWQQMQSMAEENRKAIDSTQSALISTRADMEDSIARSKAEVEDAIARNHAELVSLQEKGERDYYEFDLGKAHQFEREGPVGMRLRKANVKHQYADLELLVDDIKLSKKHVNLYEPTFFYTVDYPGAVEVVINSISQDHITGYVSAPKYGRADLAANAVSLGSVPQQVEARQVLPNPNR